MDPRSPSSRLRRNQDQEQEQAGRQAAEQAGASREFATVEDLIRYDAANTEPPRGVEERLKESVAVEQVVRPVWWKRLLGRRE